MPLKQASFNFDFEPEEKPAEPEKPSMLAEPLPELEKMQTGEPIDVEFRGAKPGTDRKSTRGRIRISDMNAAAVLAEIPDDETIAQKRYYSIGEVSVMFKVNASLLRFWESEFSILKPKKNGKGDRFFRPEDIRNLKLIYHLLRERKYTIEGARDFMKNSRNAERKFELIDSLKSLRGFLLELKANA